MSTVPGIRVPLLVQIHGVPREARPRLASIVKESFTGLYRWHALRTLGSVDRVRAAVQGDDAVGLAMFTLLEPGLGYLYYIAVRPSHRAGGVGGLLLDDSLAVLRDAGAREVFACIRAENTTSIRLFSSRGFARSGFRDLARQRGVGGALRLWRRMVAAPGERVFRRALPA